MAHFLVESYKSPELAVDCMDIGNDERCLHLLISYEHMLLAGLACLLSDCGLDSPSVCESAGLEGLCIRREAFDGNISDVICKFLELGVLGNEVGFASEAYYDGLVSLYAGNNSSLGGLTVSPLGCHELSFLADDLLRPRIVAFGFYESFLAVHHAGSGHLTQFHYVSCFDIHCSDDF